MTAQIIHGNNLDVLPTFADCSVDSVVTDPPYELGFMGKKWDASGIAYNVELWRQCLRVLKPGGHLLAFGGTRTYHRMTVAIEDAGFEIRDSIHWLYGSGFPKSLDVSKAIDKAAGAERSRIVEYAGQSGSLSGPRINVIDAGAAITDAARQWDGWGTALKPAHEPIVLARKPLAGTVADNVLTYRTGALNIDECRVGMGREKPSTWFKQETRKQDQIAWANVEDTSRPHELGRWPANVILDDTITDDWARYFYCAKPSRTERNAGLDGLPKRRKSQLGSDKESRDGLDPVSARFVSADPVANTHPTVKPLTLMRYLIRLVTPPGGTVLEPFAGSGTTLAAATLENMNSIGIEMTDDYLPIIEARIKWAEEQTKEEPPSLF
jgi:DNA modification methylase